MNKKINRELIGIIMGVIIAIIGRVFFSHNEGTIINQTNASNSPLIANSSGIIINYTDTKDPNYMNARSALLKGLNPEELAKQFLILQNESKFSDACSILPKKKGDKGCNSVVGTDLSAFSKLIKQYQMGYENIETKALSDKFTNYKQIVCVKYSYVLKSDYNPSRIREKYAYYFDKREDGEWELSSRVCERKYKENSGEKNCGYENNNRICDNILK